MNRPPLENGASSDGSSHTRDRQAEIYWNRAVMSGCPQSPAVESQNDRVVGPAEAHRTLDDDFQNWLEFRRRGADNPQDLRGSSLLLQRLRKFAPESFGFLCTARLSTRTLSAGKTLTKPFDFLD
jgi:hypothetical protein